MGSVPGIWTLLSLYVFSSLMALAPGIQFEALWERTIWFSAQLLRVLSDRVAKHIKDL